MDIVETLNTGAGKATLAVLAGVVSVLGTFLALRNRSMGRDDLFETYRENVIDAMTQNDALVEKVEVRAEFAIHGLEAILQSADSRVDSSEARDSLNLVKTSSRMVRGLVAASRNGRSIDDVEKMTNGRGALAPLRRMLNSENKTAGKLSDSAYDIVFDRIEAMIAKSES